MKLESYTRTLHEIEINLLKRKLDKTENLINKKIVYKKYILSLIVFIIFGLISYKLDDGFFKFLFGLISVLSLMFLIFTPSIFKDQLGVLKHRRQILNKILSTNKVCVNHIKVNKIAIAQEYEDEGLLYIIELENKFVLFLWDIEYNFDKVLPCSEFEIYDNDFNVATGVLLRKTGNNIEPIIIDKTVKWNYLKNNNVPDNLSIQEINFDEFILKFKES